MNYLGAKGQSGTIAAVCGAMPPHDTYLETHLGSGRILREKMPAARSIGIDIDAQTLATVAPLLPPDVELVNADCVAFLEGFDFAGAGRVLLYADPPYVAATRTSDKRYRYEYTDADHRRLVGFLRGLPANVSVMISGYPSALYDELLADWRAIEWQASTRGGIRTEKLWMNYPAGPAHWHSRAGANFRQRLRIKRKAERWAAMYAAMPPGERQAVLAAILATHDA